MVDFDVIRYSALLLLIGILKASYGSYPYISPGIQIGITSKANFFMSAQITFGYVSSDPDIYNIYSDLPPYGVTIGVRTYRMQRKEWKEYAYVDFQIWPFVGGLGIGKIIDIRNNIQYTRYKAGVGLLSYVTYDYSKDFGILKHNFGLIGTIPIARKNYGWGYYPSLTLNNIR